MYELEVAGQKRIKLWTDPAGIEPSAMSKIYNTAKLPFVYKHVAIMPDCHDGIGAVVGTVIATRGAVLPAAVGVDVGCGMMAALLPVLEEDLPSDLAGVRSLIEAVVPVGFDEHKNGFYGSHEVFSGFEVSIQGRDHDLKNKAVKQLGTLGGGNHFIELCLDTDGQVWVMLHSGSRGTGNRVAQHFIDEAKGLMRDYVDCPDQNLAALIEGTPLFESYWRSLQWLQKYAMANREMMMKNVLAVLQNHVFKNAGDLRPKLMVNCHHNYAERETHFGENLIVTRKGAVRAQDGDLCIIPGSMGTKSYIVRGKGNEDSFCSCSHGAGRRMSRGAAKKQFTLEDVFKQTAGVECKKDASVIDELPGAYKDIDVVMKNQEDLVEVVAELRQIVCVKG